MHIVHALYEVMAELVFKARRAARIWNLRGYSPQLHVTQSSPISIPRSNLKHFNKNINSFSGRYLDIVIGKKLSILYR